MKNLWSKLATWSLAGLITANAAGTIYYFVLKEQLRDARPRASLAEGGTFPPFSGIDVRGAKWEATQAPCRVIRITDDRCSFCRKDAPSYQTVVDAARQASCEIIEVSPQADGMADNPRPGIVQLKFVDANIGSVLFPFVTPQTVIVDDQWKVLWIKRGILDEQSLTRSAALLSGLPPGEAPK